MCTKVSLIVLPTSNYTDIKIWHKNMDKKKRRKIWNIVSTILTFFDYLFYYYLTIQSDGTLSLAQRVLADTTIVAEVTILQISYGQPHVRPVTVLHDAGGILLVGQYHLGAKEPVAHRPWISFRVAVDRYVRPSWCTDQLIRHEDHRRDFNIKRRNRLRLETEKPGLRWMNNRPRWRPRQRLSRRGCLWGTMLEPFYDLSSTKSLAVNYTELFQRLWWSIAHSYKRLRSLKLSWNMDLRLPTLKYQCR